MFFSAFLADDSFGAFGVAAHVLTHFFVDFALGIDEVTAHWIITYDL